MLGRARAQSSSPSVPPAPKQSTVQAPAQPASGVQTPEGPPQAVRRTVTVTFDYDFSTYPPCSAKAKKKCIQQFNVYEVSAPKPIFLFTIPVPANAKGMVSGISGSSPNKRVFFTGPHRFGVSAKMARRTVSRIRISAWSSRKCCLMMPRHPRPRQAVHHLQNNAVLISRLRRQAFYGGRSMLRRYGPNQNSPINCNNFLLCGTRPRQRKNRRLRDSNRLGGGRVPLPIRREINDPRWHKGRIGEPATKNVTKALRLVVELDLSRSRAKGL